MRWSQRGARSSHAAGRSRHYQWQYMGTASGAAEYVDFIYFNLLATHDLAAQIECNLSAFAKTSDMTAAAIVRALTVFDPLLARTALVVERHDIFGGVSHVGYDEADMRIKFIPMLFGLGDATARFRAASGLIHAVNWSEPAERYKLGDATGVLRSVFAGMALNASQTAASRAVSAHNPGMLY